MSKRWDPAYNAEELTREIARLAGAFKQREYPFFDLTDAAGPYCQGDILELDLPVPCIDEDGAPAALKAPSKFWMLVGNSCDHHRTLSEVAWTQAVPLESRERTAMPADRVRDLPEYTFARKFYVPTWPGSSEVGTVYLADLLRMVSVHRNALKPTMLRGRLSEQAWYLLHACLIRFLARGDGRMD